MPRSIIRKTTRILPLPPVFALLILALMLAADAGAECDPIATVAEGTLVYHGTPVGIFSWSDPSLNPAPPYDHPRSPDGPAWFADDWQFSVHAGLRFLMGQSDIDLHLYRYSLTQQIAVLECSTTTEWAAETGISLQNGDYPAAQEFCSTLAVDQYNGYLIDYDAVRRQPELILCQPSEVLALEATETWWVTQIDDDPYFYTGGSGKDFSNNTWNCLLDNNDLLTFFCQEEDGTTNIKRPNPKPGSIRGGKGQPKR